MTHNISLHRGWLGRVITITVLSVFVPLTTTACFGTFPLARKVYRWNASVHSDKWIRWLVFLLINVIPVYAGAAILDMVFSNSVEFWTGRNPMAAAPGSTKLVEGPNGERALMTLREDRAIDVRITAPGVPEQRFVLVHEVDAIAAYDADGKLVARAGEGSDGEPTLLGAVIAR
ncbi:MAG: DUF3332 family protein [Deltaproteobacteria bacterium]|nr:DUF3332 family protein [Deltaproteobacteria bacterium]